MSTTRRPSSRTRTWEQLQHLAVPAARAHLKHCEPLAIELEAVEAAVDAVAGDEVVGHAKLEAPKKSNVVGALDNGGGQARWRHAVSKHLARQEVDAVQVVACAGFGGRPRVEAGVAGAVRQPRKVVRRRGVHGLRGARE